jgi:hypothetical protein
MSPVDKVVRVERSPACPTGGEDLVSVAAPVQSQRDRAAASKSNVSFSYQKNSVPRNVLEISDKTQYDDEVHRHSGYSRPRLKATALQYFGVDLEIVRGVIERDLPALKELAQEIRATPESRSGERQCPGAVEGKPPEPGGL